MPYKVIFNFVGSETEPNRPRVAVSCDGLDIPEDEGTHAAVDWLVQFQYNEKRDACLTVNNSQTLQLHKGRFLYMDVGCWLNGQHTFGLVCGHEAALCHFVLNEKTSLADYWQLGQYEKLLNQFLNCMNGVSIGSRMDIPDPHPADSNHLYVIVPDMHLAAAPPLIVPAPPGPPIPYDLVDKGISHRNPEYDRYMAGPAYQAYKTFYEASNRDFFHSRVSIPAMCVFLRQLCAFPRAKDVTLVQVGDMYELWAGRPCLYGPTPADEPHVELLHGDGTPQGDRLAEVGSWVGNTHLLEPDLFQAFDACEAAGIKTEYLHGNHDNYTIVREVVDAANDYILKSLADRTTKGIATSWMMKSLSTKVHQRRQPKIEDNLFIEHGHRCDGPNRDGSTKGQGATDLGAVIGDAAMLLDSTRRSSFVTGAAAYWYRNVGKFGLYVQGHTHTALLEYVDVTTRLEDERVEAGPFAVLPMIAHLRPNWIIKSLSE